MFLDQSNSCEPRSLRDSLTSISKSFYLEEKRASSDKAVNYEDNKNSKDTTVDFFSIMKVTILRPSGELRHNTVSSVFNLIRFCDCYFDLDVLLCILHKSSEKYYAI